MYIVIVAGTHHLHLFLLPLDGRGNQPNHHEDVPPRKEEKEPESVSEEADLLDVNNWDDVPRIANEPYYAGDPPHIPPQASYTNAPGNPFGMPASSTALVPTAVAPSYPGAPPPQPPYGMASAALVPAAAPSYPVAPPQYSSYPGAPYAGAPQPPPPPGYPAVATPSYPAGAPQWQPTPGYAPPPADPWAQPPPRPPMPPPQY
jgi:hypothetical protein